MERSEWQGRPVDHWRRLWCVPRLHIFDTVGSTNDVARELAANGAPAGTTVLADEQTRGRGQRSRYWTAPAGLSLSMSMVTRPPSAGAARLLTLRLGLTAARALETALPIRLHLKWPNDLIADGRKVGGILCEGNSDGGRIRSVVAGIGLNLRTPPDGWPAELADRAGSLADAAGAPVDPEVPAGAIATSWAIAAGSSAVRLTEHELTEFARRDTLQGRTISVDGVPAGTARGVSATGALDVDTPDGRRQITAGTIRALDRTPGETT